MFGCNCSYSELMKKNVIDKEGNKIGKNLIDVVFSPSFEISHFVVGGGALEEFLEDIKLKKDVDPVFEVTNIDTITDSIKLNVAKNELGTVITGAIPEGHYQLSKLGKKAVVDKDGKKIGNIINMAFFDDDTASFIIGGSTIQEFLEKIGVIPDIDLIVPLNKIKEVTGDEIKINLSQADLKTTLEQDIKLGKELHDSDFGDSRKKIGLISHHRVDQTLDW
ncbi:MAG: hypothetical protein ACTSP4_05455 [Candidatus Hodarchaeales archaeon]